MARWLDVVRVAAALAAVSLLGHGCGSSDGTSSPADARTRSDAGESADVGASADAGPPHEDRGADVGSNDGLTGGDGGKGADGSDGGTGADGRDGGAGTDGSSDGAVADGPLGPEVAPHAGSACGYGLLVAQTQHAGTLAVLTPGNYSATTDPAGKFCFTDLPAGTYALRLSNGPYHAESAAVTNKPAAAPSKEWSLTVADAATGAARPVWLTLRPGRQITDCLLADGGMPSERRGDWLSADRTRVLVRCGNDLGTVPLAGGPFKSLATYTTAANPEQIGILRGAWLWLGESGRLDAVPAAGGGVVDVATDVQRSDLQIAPDGGQALFTTKSSPYNLFSVAATGGTATALSAARPQWFRFTADGTRVLVEADGAVKSVAVGGGDSVRLGTTYQIAPPALSEDGKRVGMADTTTNRLLIAGVEGKDITTIGISPGFDAVVVSLSPDGAFMTVDWTDATGGHAVGVGPTKEGASLTTLTTNGLGPWHFGLVGRQRDRPLFAKRDVVVADHLMLVAADGSAVTDLGTLKPLPGGIPLVSDDRTRAAFVDDTGDLRVADLDAGTTVVIHARGVLNSPIALSPDGSMLVYRAGSEVRLVTTGASPVEVANLGAALSAVFSPDSRRLATSDTVSTRVLSFTGNKVSGTLFVMDLATTVAWLDADTFYYFYGTAPPGTYIVDLQ